jgi:7,8-didemethyl-8-hydroxy-5-deazariboflavin synthase CofG subunit
MFLPVTTQCTLIGVMRSSIDAILEKLSLRGESLSANEGYRLIGCDDSELPSLIRAAGARRDLFKGRTVTYSRKIFLPVTNLCRDRCSYCTFRKDPNDPDAWTMNPDEIDQTLMRGSERGCKEALMCLGDKPELAFPQYRQTLAEFGHRTTAEYVYRACVMAAKHGFLPHTNAGILSYDEMKLLRPVNVSLGLMLENVSPRLTQKGMPHYSAPDKQPTVRLRMLREAGELSIAFTTGILIGIGETRQEVVDSLIAIRELHEQYGHIQEVIIQNFRAKPDTRMAGFPEPDSLEVARTVAVARLLFDRDMNIQVPPNLNPDDHKVILRAGINDWGGISPVTKDYVNPEAAWPHIQELANTCREEGFTLRERLAIYDEYIDRGRFLPDMLRPIVEKLQADIHATVLTS